MDLHIPSKARFHQVEGNKYVIFGDRKLPKDADPVPVGVTPTGRMFFS
jgi:hypothetical protein